MQEIKESHRMSQMEINKLATAIRNELYGTSFEVSISTLLAILISKGVISGEDVLKLKGTEDTECKK